MFLRHPLNFSQGKKDANVIATAFQGAAVGICITYLRSEVGAIATDASADKPGSEAEPDADRGKPMPSGRKSSAEGGGSVVGGGGGGGVDSELGIELTISAAEGS